MGIFSNLFNPKRKENQINDFLERGALVVDVRTKEEFAGGHIKKSINIPVGAINSKVDFLKKKNKPILLCCASGMRSGRASGILKAQGIECINAGSVARLENLIK